MTPNPNEAMIIAKLHEDTKRLLAMMRHSALTVYNPNLVIGFEDEQEPRVVHKRRFALLPKRMTSGRFVWMDHYWARIREVPDSNFYIGDPGWVLEARLTEFEYADYRLSQ